MTYIKNTFSSDVFSIFEGNKCSNAISLVATSLVEAKSKCSAIEGCLAFYSECGNSQIYKYCTSPLDIVADSCDSVLYSKGR